ncbi:acyl-CoA dehydrogenase [Skermanella stibiiresistens SB22]|uniref:3-sulfinopropanoyl-CoA desulfinase n=1 Tax=Skermanella stibiiresistens SB22 TaxID=1385369 RepID=W9GTI2_9PROT|nr:acyl-CoA dehydrogenase family protein [Skermanella stibiiresistens]EWY35996.1 acyl-CoA dehydrogenase [Skermanella stibiiresistens SB22]
MHPFSTEEDRAVAEGVRRFAERVVAPRARAIDEDGVFAGEHLAALAEIGLLGMNLPERWGGAGVSAVGLYLAVEALAGACASTTSMVTAHFLAGDAILIGGDDVQRAEWLPAMAAGRALGAFALTEPRAGSNPADMSTKAVPDGQGGYRLSGVKHFISNAGAADLLVVFAITDPAAGHRGISAFVVDRTMPGVSVGKAEPTMGLRGGHVFEVAFEDCALPPGRRLGTEGSGFRTAMKVLDNGRIEVAATSTGIAAAALDAAVAWAKVREVDGAPIGRFQGLQWMLADMATELEAARVLGLRAARLRADVQRFSTEASMAKLFASEAAGRITDKAIQIHGGYGYSREMPLERYARDARIMRIYEGSSEIQRNIIARGLLA